MTSFDGLRADALPFGQGCQFAAFTGQRTDQAALALAPTGQQHRQAGPAAPTCGKCEGKGQATSQRVLVPDVQRLRLILGQVYVKIIGRINESINKACKRPSRRRKARANQVHQGVATDLFEDVGSSHRISWLGLQEA